MANTVKPKPDSKPFAVIRSYRPIRIERELLAQVFDLAERGRSAYSGGVEEQSLFTDQINDQRENPPALCGSFDKSASQQRDALETVA